MSEGLSQDDISAISASVFEQVKAIVTEDSPVLKSESHRAQYKLNLEVVSLLEQTNWSEEDLEKRR